jgi:hypothetical protein
MKTEKYFVMGYTTGFDPTVPPYPALLTRKEFNTLAEVKAYLATIHAGHLPFVVKEIDVKEKSK